MTNVRIPESKRFTKNKRKSRLKQNTEIDTSQSSPYTCVIPKKQREKFARRNKE